jgi:predicted house-cleaning noncanonical NTP pyrophosphatase (MazG superfamily)
MASYKKLVRDKIPELIAEKGEHPMTRTLTDDTEYITELLAKLVEEASECAATNDSEALTAELADLEEVILALISVTGIDPHEIEHVREHKHEERGGFEQRIFLESVT